MSNESLTRTDCLSEVKKNTVAPRHLVENTHTHTFCLNKNVGAWVLGGLVLVWLSIIQVYLLTAATL